MENIRFAHDIFSGKASVKTENTYNDAILCVCRELDNTFLVGLFNFSDEPQTAWINMGDFEFEDLISGEKRVLQAVEMSGNGYAWYYRTW